MNVTDPVARQRALRRRHKHERQAVVFGALIATLAVVALVSSAIYTGTLEAPFARGFSTEAPQISSDAPAPCPPDGALPVAYANVQLNVLNGTKTAGLAGTSSAELTTRGFTVLSTGNYAKPVPQTARIMFGATGLAAAYTVAAQFDKPLLVLDTREDATVDVAVGALYVSLVATDKVALAPDVPLTPYAGCVAIGKITPVPGPTATAETDAPDAGDASAAG